MSIDPIIVGVTNGEDAAASINAVIAAVNALPQTVTVTVALDAADILTLHSIPVALIAAPGAGKYIRVVSLDIPYTFNTERFYADTIQVRYGSGHVITGSYPLLDATESYVFHEFVGLRADLADVENQPVAITSTQEAAGFGLILTTSLGSSGGADYAPGDTFDINSFLNLPQAGTVDTVDGGGSVLTYHLGAPTGVFFANNDSPTTATSGIGTGLLIDIDSVTPIGDGSAEVIAVYEIVDV